MGVASYREDDLTRFLESTEQAVVSTPPPPPRQICPFCQESFEQRLELNEHLTNRHIGERPVLMFRGRAAVHSFTIRQPVDESDFAPTNCNTARISLDGGSWRDASPDILPATIASHRDAEVKLELTNRFDPVAQPAIQRYRLTIRIAEKAALDAVDRAFMEHMATEDPLHVDHVSDFLGDSRCQGVAGEYAEALRAYSHGVLTRDQASGRGVSLPPGDANKLYGQALEGLKDFERPLSNVVCALVRFSFNDFSLANRPCGFLKLDNCNARLASLLTPDTLRADGLRETEYAAKDGTARTVSICPVDQATDRVLDLADRLERQTHWGPTLLEDCRQAGDAETLSREDRDKVHALWAESAIGHGDAASAREPLRNLRATYPFGDWAADHLDRMED